MAHIYGVTKVDEIIDNLYLTSVYGASRENIQARGVTLLINSAQELPKQEIPGVESVKLFLDDVSHANIQIYFDRMADKMNDHLSRGGRVLVHCMMGVSRSTSLILAYLMKYKHMSLKSAYELVSMRRPIIRPNPGFWRQLLDFEKQMLTKKGIGMSSSSRAPSAGAAPSRVSMAGPSSSSTAIPIQVIKSSSSKSQYYNTSDYNSHSRPYSGNYSNSSANRYGNAPTSQHVTNPGFKSTQYYPSSSSSYDSNAGNPYYGSGGKYNSSETIANRSSSRTKPMTPAYATTYRQSFGRF